MKSTIQLLGYGYPHDYGNPQVSPKDGRTIRDLPIDQTDRLTRDPKTSNCYGFFLLRLEASLSDASSWVFFSGQGQKTMLSWLICLGEFCGLYGIYIYIGIVHCIYI